MGVEINATGDFKLNDNPELVHVQRGTVARSVKVF